MIRVAVLDDHPFILRSVHGISGLSPRPIEVVQSCTTAAEFLEKVRLARPDVAVVDLIMDGKVTGHLVIQELSELGIPSIVFTADHRPVPLYLAMGAGARGLVLKTEPIEHLVQAIVSVVRTGWAPSSALAQTVLSASASVPALTPQELTCLRLAAQGVPVKAIGRQFQPEISQSTVKTYLKRAYEKYASVGRAVSNTTQAAVEAMGDGWFDVPVVEMPAAATGDPAMRAEPSSHPPTDPDIDAVSPD
mgnify:CR=1 FL=1